MNNLLLKFRLVSYIILSFLIRLIVKTKENKIFLFSYYGKMYACNPQALTEYILHNYPQDYLIYWAFNKDVDTSFLDKRIHVVRKYDFSYFYHLYSSKFIIHNSRDMFTDSFFIKKKTQKYIMTWHGPFALKKIEKDAEKELSSYYIKSAKRDSNMCDLMLSNSAFFTNIIKQSFWYNGEILEACSPRNDIFYDEEYKRKCYKNVRENLIGCSLDTIVVLYAPTFRKDNSLSYYKLNWDKIIPEFEQKFGQNVEVLIRLHPNMCNMKGIDEIFDFSKVHNVTHAPSITDFLFAADIMISDYTSAMFDFCTLRKPCFIYAVDYKEYDRGFYWDFNQLPFPFSSNLNELILNISQYNSHSYLMNLDSWIKNTWHLEDDGHSCERLLKWIGNNK